MKNSEVVNIIYQSFIENFSSDTQEKIKKELSIVEQNFISNLNSEQSKTFFDINNLKAELETDKELELIKYVISFMKFLNS